ncbi:diaminopimelate decarboxylase, partial [Robertmurraya sp. P23]
MFFHGSSKINERGHLEIGGVDTTDLVKEFGTPVYVYDVSLIRERARGFKQTFDQLGIKAQVAYASKAFSTIAMIQL